MKENYNRNGSIYNDLSKYNIYINDENNPLVTMTEKIIEYNFNSAEADRIFSYCYDEKEDITTEELYDEIIGEHN